MAATTTTIEIEAMITVGALAEKLSLPVSRVIGELMKNGVMATVNERIDFDTAQIIVDDPRNYVKVGDTVKAKIIAIDKDRLSLSLKQMSDDPWLSEVKTFSKGDTVEGKVTRITPFGAFVQISPSVEALVHVSEMGESNAGDGVDPEKIFQLNEKKQFKVLDIDADNRKIALSLKDAN